MVEHFTKSGNIYSHDSGKFRIRERKGRAYEVEFAERPSLWISTGSRDFEGAAQFAEKRLNATRKFLDPNKVTFKRFADGIFLETGEDSLRARNELFGKMHDDAYYKELDGYMRNYIMPKFKDWKIVDITDIAVEDWYVGLISVRKGTLLCPTSRLRVLDAFEFTMDEAKRKGIITTNPISSVRRVSTTGECKEKREIFSDEEIHKLFPLDMNKLPEIWGSMQWAVYFSIMADTGFRPGEVSALSKENICETESGYGVYQTTGVNPKTRKIQQRVKTTGHGKSSKKGVLSDYTNKMLREYLKDLKTDYLFLNKKGNFYYPNKANNVLIEACEKVGIDRRTRTQYCFRHTFDTYMLDSLGDKIEESDVRELMGHTGYRPEYDHRTPEQVISRLTKIKPAIDSFRNAE